MYVSTSHYQSGTLFLNPFRKCQTHFRVKKGMKSCALYPGVWKPLWEIEMVSVTKGVKKEAWPKV